MDAVVMLLSVFVLGIFIGLAAGFDLGQWYRDSRWIGSASSGKLRDCRGAFYHVERIWSAKERKR